MQRIFPLSANHGSPFSLYRKLRGVEIDAHSLALTVCNRPVDDEYIARVTEDIRYRLNVLLHLRDSKIPIEINLDARGYALKIPPEHARDLDIERDMGGYGIVAPEVQE